MEFSKPFNLAFDLLMEDEGGFANDPDDPGGATKFGITQKTYERFIGHGVVLSEMKNLTLEVAKEIYLKNYWNPLCLHSVDKPAIAICIFNTGVLYGQFISASIAQKTANNLGASIKVDGLIGSETAKILNSIQEKEFLKMFHKLLLERIETVIFNNAKLEKYRKGWTNRTHRLLTLADISSTKLV